MENVFYKLHIARLSYNNQRVCELLRLIDAYDFCNNGCNGIQTEREIRKSKDNILKRLDEI